MKKAEERLAVLETKVDDIITNHLPHIDSKVNELLNKLDKLHWWIVGTLVSILLALVSRLIK